MDKPTITITVSEARSFHRCEQQHYYVYRQGLKRRLEGRPLKLGNWLHYTLQHMYDGTGWKGALDKLVAEEWDVLFPEERTYYGDLPAQVSAIMRSYEEYYKDDEFELVLPPETAFDVTVETTNFFVRFLGKVDLVVRDRGGHIFTTDHKSSISIPNEHESKTFQTMEPQLTLYPWAIERQYGVKTYGTMYNYVKTSVPTRPHLNKDGKLSRAKINTDEYTFREACAEYGVDPSEYPEQLEAAIEGTSTFFYRLRVPRDTQATRSTLQNLVGTAIAKEQYRTPTRNVVRECSYCDVREICEVDFFGMERSAALNNYTKVDPYAYLGIQELEEAPA